VVVLPNQETTSAQTHNSCPFLSPKTGQFEVVPDQFSGAWKIEWMNANGETGLPFDVKLCNETEEVFLEVKTTTRCDKRIFEFSLSELACAKKYGRNYMIARVFLAPTEASYCRQIPASLPPNPTPDNHRVIVIKSPYEMIEKRGGVDLLLQF
jgi:hypothetical protein